MRSNFTNTGLEDHHQHGTNMLTDPKRRLSLEYITELKISQSPPPRSHPSTFRVDGRSSPGYLYPPRLISHAWRGPRIHCCHMFLPSRFDEFGGWSQPAGDPCYALRTVSGMQRNDRPPQGVLGPRDSARGHGGTVDRFGGNKRYTASYVWWILRRSHRFLWRKIVYSSRWKRATIIKYTTTLGQVGARYVADLASRRWRIEFITAVIVDRKRWKKSALYREHMGGGERRLPRIQLHEVKGVRMNSSFVLLEGGGQTFYQTMAQERCTPI